MSDLLTNSRSISLSPCHNHVFIAMQSGNIVTFDLLCLRTSPYIVPNLWKDYEDKMLASGNLVAQNAGSLAPVDVIHHPRDLNFVFVAYAGGVVLCNLTERNAIRHYELVLPPGAPGGIGYNDPELLINRYPAVTALSIHPSGHILAIGYADGCIAFWAVEDEDKALQVRTMDEVNVNVAHGEKLADLLAHASNDVTAPSPKGVHIREPIFKLSWSGLQGSTDVRVGPTILSIFGGLYPQDGNGVSALLLPAFEPSAASALSPSNHDLHPDVRAAMVASLETINTYLYLTPGPTQDFLLIPRNSPHFSGTLDPISILLLSELNSGERMVEAKEFPPPEFVHNLSTQDMRQNAPAVGIETPDNVLGDDLADTLKEMQLASEPTRLPLPSALWTGTNGILDGDILHLEKEVYNRLVEHDLASPNDSPIRGGMAWANNEENNIDAMRSAKWQPRRLLITHHGDLTIRFQDISPQRLLGSDSSQLTAAFPAPLNSLTIDLPATLSESSITSHGQPIDLRKIEIQSVRLTTESAECVVVLKSGHIVLYRFSEKSRALSVINQVNDAELMPLTHLAARENVFQPILFLDNTWGSVCAYDMSNIGFLSVAYRNGALLIVNMRGPDVIYREDPESKTHNRRSISIIHHGHSDIKSIQSLKWVFCGFDHDSTPRLRLLASYASGSTRVFTLKRVSSSGAWMVNEGTKVIESADQPLPRASFVINNKTGASCAANRSALAREEPGAQDTPTDEAHCFWISAGTKGAKSVVNLAGHRGGKADWGKDKVIEAVEIIGKSGAYALVAITVTREALIYTLPTLEPMFTLQLAYTPSSAISLDETGDFVDWTFDERSGTVSKMTLGTFFAMKRPHAEPLIDFIAGRQSVPAQPQPMSIGPNSFLGSLFSFQKSASGDQIDALLAGPDRPLKAASATADIESQRHRETRTQGLVNQGSRIGNDLYSSLTSAVNDRGEMLSGLEESFRSLEESSKSMLSQAKRLAAEQTGKSWLGF